MVALFLFLLGTTIGSFLTVVIDRLPKGISIVHGRSHCDSCNHTLSWLDLIPLFSFVILQGKCRYCKKPIGVHHLLLELIVGALFVVTYFATLGSLGAELVYSSVFVSTLTYRLFLICVLFIIFFIDLRHSIIPFAAVAAACVVSLLWMIIVSPIQLPNAFLAAFGSFLFFFLIHAVTKGKGMGFGDVIFSFFMGFLLGFPTVVVAIYIAFLTGSVLSLILILAKRKKLKSAIPFGPFLVIGTVSCLLWGSQLTHAFLVFLHII